MRRVWRRSHLVAPFHCFGGRKEKRRRRKEGRKKKAMKRLLPSFLFLLSSLPSFLLWISFEVDV